MLASTFAALYERIANGADFSPSFAAAFAREARRRRELEKQEKDIQARITRLVGAIERGVNEESATQRIIELQDELLKIRLDMAEDTATALPSEAVIRTELKRAVQRVEATRDVIETRLLFQHLLKEVVLTPIPDRPRGETTRITLREEGWPAFWRMIMDLPGKSGERFSDYAASASKRHGLLYSRAECRLTGL